MIPFPLRNPQLPMRASTWDAEIARIKAWSLDTEKLKSLVPEDDDDGNDVFKNTNAKRKVFMHNVVANYKTSISSTENYQSFAEQHYTTLIQHMKADEKDNYRHGTLLHALVSQLERTDQWKMWVKFILDVAKAMSMSILDVKSSNNNNNTCLHEATTEGALDFIKFVGSISDSNDMRNAIAAVNIRGQNCLHLAIAESNIWGWGVSKFSIIDYLTQQADSEILKTKRERTDREDTGAGNTCLHDLVDITHCKVLKRRCPVKDCNECKTMAYPQGFPHEYASKYLEILRAMARKCPEAMTTMNEAKQSPFLFHISTRSQEKATETWGRLELSSADDNVDDIPKQNCNVLVESMGKSQILSAHLRENKKLAGELNEKPSSKPKARILHQNPRSEHSRDLATDVSKELMELCLAQPRFSDICDSLFGHRYPNSELMFKAAPLTEKTTDKHRALSLDPILACVELGLDDTISSLRDGHSAQSIASNASEKAARAHREKLIIDFFDWLRKDHGVKRIIKLVVSDHPYLPCRDHVISHALKGFDIRYLDWDKEDLCVQSLTENKISINLRELWLSWSGRNSALLGWSNKEDGLWRLDKLETVYVSTNAHWEQDSTNQKNLSKFTATMSQFTPNATHSQSCSRCNIHLQSQACLQCEKRLTSEGNSHGIVVKRTDDGELNHDFDEESPSQELQGALKKGDIWLEAVHAFRTALEIYVHKDANNRKLFDKVKGKVKVAIIDDGVNLEALDGAAYIAGGWHPERKAPDRKAMNAWYCSEKNHGTEMARLVHIVCPYVSLYVAKLDTRRLVYKSVAESAAKAIGASIDNGANVISMSWTMYQSVDNKEGIEELSSAIKDAGKIKDKGGGTRNTLMFCASEDNGRSSYRQPYPATKCDTNIIKRVGSAGNYGERSDYVDPDAIDYLFPGEIASSRKLCSGSSASTALAAGLSGLILWCAAWQNEEASSSIGISESRLQLEGQLMRDTDLQIKADHTIKMSETVNFQTHEHMYALFDALKHTKENPLVNITSYLFTAAKHHNPPAKLIEFCTQKVRANIMPSDSKPY